MYFIISGDLWQLPPIYDNLVTDNNNLDGRPECSPSHWEENFKIFYLTEKMRSQSDNYFSDLCDRVGRGNLTESDERWLQSRVIQTDSENSNESFKEGNLLIIVTTNMKKDFINKEKLSKLLPYERQYSCNSIDRVTNLPVGSKLPESMTKNPGKTGNLQEELILKVGAPVVITNNHSKQKYREDGIMNGARGFVQAIQTSIDNQERVEVVWIVFKNENIGKRYRHDHQHLRQSFNPGHENATPILPTRRNFKINFGNIEYQRQNFPLSLSYALTAHKCQGETLQEVIIDFGPDLEHKIRNYICSGSFYVALTRVREGNKVFLRSFDKSYIQVNKKIEEKVEAMIKYRGYEFRKIYLDHKIFEVDELEIKAGYLNINGLLDGNHGLYFNGDKNLQSLDFIVLAETKLTKEKGTSAIEASLSNWKILARYDSQDSRKHMGLMLLTSRASKFNGEVSITYQTAKRDASLQIEGIIMRLKCNLKFGFVYCRSAPTNPEIKAIIKYFDECNVLMGDLNLSHRVKQDQSKVDYLCGQSKFSALKEITRSISNNQLDYILLDENLRERSFVTSFNNFISDHKSITARIGLEENQFTKNFKIQINFDRESHRKSKMSKEDEEYDVTSTSDEEKSIKSSIDYSSDEYLTIDSNPREEGEISLQNQHFKRRFKNIDMSSCWLNSCLQLVLIGLDHSGSSIHLDSELGIELKRLRSNERETCLDPTIVKNIIVATEDTRIALRLSELESEIEDQIELQHQVEVVNKLRLDLYSGQQCVKDFFVCLVENTLSWPEVCSSFYFKVTHSTECCACNHLITSETTQLYVEIEVPPDNTNLNEYVEEFFNISELQAMHCEACQNLVQKAKRSKLTLGSESEFIIVILNRGIETLDGFELVKNCTSPTNDVFIR